MFEERYIKIKEKVKSILLPILILVCIVETMILFIVHDNYMETKQYHDYIDREQILIDILNIETEIEDIKKSLE